MATFSSAVQSGDWSGACAVAEPGEQADCNKSLRKVGSEKVTFKNVSYTVSHVGSSTAEAKLRITACVSGHCETSSTSGELVKQNGNWYVSNSTGAFGNSAAPGTLAPETRGTPATVDERRVASTSPAWSTGRGISSCHART